MELSVFVAQVAALIYLSVGIAALSSRIHFGKLIESFEQSQGLTYVTGFVTIVIGMLLVKYHNIWVKDWTVLITIIGWAAIIKGVMFIAFPQSIFFFKPMFKNTQAWGLPLIALGLLFGYFGFVA